MTFTLNKLCNMSFISSTALPYIMNSGNIGNPITKTYIKSIIIYNNNTTLETVSMWNVPNQLNLSGTANSSNKFYSVNLAPNEMESIEFQMPIVLNGINDSIFVSSNSNGFVTIQSYGANE